MDLEHGFGAQVWPLREKEETVYHGECIDTAVCTAIALQSIHLFQSPSESLQSFFTHPPLPIYVYICSYVLLRVYIE